MKNIQYNFHSCDSILVRMAMRKLDAENLRMFDESLRYPKQMPIRFSVKEESNTGHIKFTPKVVSRCGNEKLTYICDTKSGPSTKNRTKDLNCGSHKEQRYNTYRCQTAKDFSVSNTTSNLCRNCPLGKKFIKCNIKYTCFECKSLTIPCYTM